jgi:hypothetical protein
LFSQSVINRVLLDERVKAPLREFLSALQSGNPAKVDLIKSFDMAGKLYDSEGRLKNFKNPLRADDSTGLMVTTLSTFDSLVVAFAALAVKTVSLMEQFQVWCPSHVFYVVFFSSFYR